MILFCLFFVISLVPLSASAQISLEQYQLFASNGAPQLAIAMIEQHQPDINKDFASWYQWERSRLNIMQQHGFWKELIERIETYPNSIPPQKRLEFAQQHVSALIQINAYKKARNILNQLIWSEPENYAAQQFKRWRKMVIETYLGERKGEDAFLAMQRFKQDYGSDQKEALLRAKVLLESGHANQAENELKSIQNDSEAENLRILATIRQKKSLHAHLNRIKSILKSDISEKQKIFYNCLVVEIAIAINEYPSRIIAMEQLFRNPEADSTIKELFNFDVDDLWDAYISYAKKVANRDQLLQGDDESWFEREQKARKFLPVRSRAYLSYLAHKSLEPKNQQRAHQLMVERIMSMPGGEHLLQKLYVESSLINPSRDIPEQAAYLLLDKAIQENNLQTASLIIQQLTVPPKGTALFIWHLRRAKIFLLAGEYNHAKDVLGSAVEDITRVTPKYRDRLVQLIFDLQTAGENSATLELLEKILQKIDVSNFKRELLYWIAEAYAKENDHVQSAYYYLSSATLFGSENMDPWAQTARFHAATALMDAGLLSDAQTMLNRLLAVTEDPARKSVIQREIEQIKLKR